ncbi:MAG: PilZ domain-containing protein, partial [Acidobacteriota bacterium]
MERGSHGRERRKYPRVAFEGEIAAKIHSVSASPIDLSATGVLLEVTRPLTANAVYTLRLDLSPREQLVLKGRVVRNYVHEFDRSGKGDTLVRYRVAIEFETLAHREQAVIQDFIDR